ncbi:flavin reductase domain-containing protein [Bacillus freudenreichii]|nr:flavin reductase domain-containing protein [Bacillus freudenreichii]
MSVNAPKKVENALPLIPSEEYRDVIGHFSSGVTIITTSKDGVDYGITASAVSSVSLEPPMLLICANKQTGTCHAISEKKTFTVNILKEDQAELAIQFARANTEKFKDINMTYSEFGDPVLKDALVSIECRVVEEITGGTHSVFMAEVKSATTNNGRPLVYYRGKFGQFDQYERA